MKEMIIGLMQNIAILFAFAMLYESFWLKIEISKKLTNQLITGLVLGVIGIVLMFTHWILVPGIVFDTRSILLSVSGLFLGPVPTIVAMLITSTIRVMIGGDGMWMGLAVIITSGSIGILWRTYRPLRVRKRIYLELYALGLTVHFVMLMCAFLLPSKDIFHTLKNIALPLILIYSPGTMLLGILLLRQSNNYQNKLAKEKLQESERRLGQILKSGNIASVILDNFGSVVFCNKYLLDITGYVEEEVINKYYFDLFLPLYLRDDIKSIFDNAMNALNDNGQNENEIIAKNGDKIYISWHFTNLMNEKNEVTGMACIGVNITDRINYELSLNAKNQEIEAHNEEYHQINEELSKTNVELIKSKEKAEESDKLKSAFLSNISHEIRTPMNGILGFAELLKENNLSGYDQKQYLKQIEKSGKRMLNIINDIVSIAKIESGQMDVMLSDTNINELIENIYDSFRPETELNGIQFIFNNSLVDEKALIKTDKDKVLVILNNLIKNAIKFSEKGSIEFGYNPIRIKGKNKPIELEFYVKDTGIGIPRDKMNAIFDYFVQADLNDKKALQGAGLGLSISKAYVGLLGGEIWGESIENRGSAFYFTIPYITELKVKPTAENPVSLIKEDDQIKKLKILIVEDDDTSEFLLSMIVKQYSNENLYARTGLETVEICRNNPDIDLILMDIQMPEMNGYLITKEIRKFNKSVIIIAQTAYAFKDDREKALEAGCNDYISKPINKDLLKELVFKYFIRSDNEN